MAFYDGLGKKIQQTGQGAIDKTKKSAEAVRLNSAVGNLEKEINSTYTELGKAYYQKYADNVQDEDMIPYFQKINDCLSQIRGHKDQISTLKGRTKCVNCGMEISATAVFCNFCGAQQVPDMAPAGDVRRCPNCGQIVEEGQAFCTGCGQRLEEEPAPQQEEQDMQDVQEAQEEPKKVCSNCGAPLEPGDAFCTNCGQPVGN